MTKISLPICFRAGERLPALIDRDHIYFSDHTADAGKPVHAPYNPFMAAWFKYR